MKLDKQFYEFGSNVFDGFEQIAT